MSQLSDAEVDASLFALGIGTDARGLRVLVVGDYDFDLTKAVDARLRSFGATVFRNNDISVSESLLCDYAVAIATDFAEYKLGGWIGLQLKPGGRYLILIDEVGDREFGTGIYEVTTLGPSAVRILGYKARTDVGADQ